VATTKIPGTFVDSAIQQLANGESQNSLRRIQSTSQCARNIPPRWKILRQSKNVLLREMPFCWNHPQIETLRSCVRDELQRGTRACDRHPPRAWTTSSDPSLADQDHHEREGYTVSLQRGNYENDLHAAQDEAFQTSGHDPFVTGSACTDINGERMDANVRMRDALLGIVANDSSGGSQEAQAAKCITNDGQHRQGNTPMRCYAIREHTTLTSNWEDTKHFTGAFPTLFPSAPFTPKPKRSANSFAS
jgi:hypothetical protein